MPDKDKYANQERFAEILHEGNLESVSYGKFEGSLRGEVQKWRRERNGAQVATPVVYSGVVWSNLNVYDRIARFILALAYTHQAAPDFLPQQLIGMNTIAVAGNGGKLYLAANGIDLKPSLPLVEEELRAEEIEQEVVLLPNLHGKDHHAEMQIIDHFAKEGMRLDDDTIGVSKPCCTSCAEKLESLGIAYSYWHDQKIGAWLSGGVDRAWW